MHTVVTQLYHYINYSKKWFKSRVSPVAVLRFLHEFWKLISSFTSEQIVKKKLFLSKIVKMIILFFYIVYYWKLSSFNIFICTTSYFDKQPSKSWCLAFSFVLRSTYNPSLMSILDILLQWNTVSLFISRGDRF